MSDGQTDDPIPQPMLPAPFDQHPADQQPIVRQVPQQSSAEPEWHPQLPTALNDALNEAARSDVAPAIPPLETTAPTEFVAATAGSIDQSKFARPEVAPRLVDPDRAGFSPLRSDPPPRLIPTWWLRWLLFASMIVAPGLALGVEYSGEIDDVRSSVAVIIAHVVVVASLLVWSFSAMHNAHRLVPPTRYQRRSQASLAVMLWVAAFAAPIGVSIATSRLRERLDDPDDMAAVFTLAGVVLVAFVLVWLPFRYHARHASRIGAPHRVVIAWFWGPLLAVVGGITILALGMREQLSQDGLTASERVIQVGVVYGLPMLVLALSTWRATTVFDEVLDLRWHRWKAEWEQTLAEMSDQPEPGPEDSPRYVLKPQSRSRSR